MESERFFTGRLNTDDYDSKIPNGDYGDNQLLRNGSAANGLAGVRSSFQGNTIIDFGDDFLPTGVNTYHGGEKIESINCFVFFYHNDTQEHSIVLYNTITQVWNIIMQSSVLMFDLNYPIYAISFIDGLLRFTDGRDSSVFFTGDVVSNPLENTRLFNPPFRINIEDGINGAYTTIDLNSIEVLKWPPWYAPKVRYISVNGVPNKIRKGAYEFIHCYGYKDGEWSVWGQVSTIARQTKSDLVSGLDFTEPFVDNGIEVQINTGPYRVRKIKIAFRVNKGLFYKFVELDKDLMGLGDNETYTYQFFNNTVNTVVAEGGGLVPPSNSSVPQTASCAALLPTNEDCYAKFYEDYDNVDVDFSLTHRSIEIPDYQEGTLQLYVANSTGGSVDIVLNFFSSPAYFYAVAGNIYALNITTISPNLVIPLRYELTQADIDLALAGATLTDQLNILITIIGNAFVQQINDALVVTLTGSATAGVYTIDVTGGVLFYAINRAGSNPVIPQRRNDAIQCCRWGWTYYLGVIYQDRGNRDGTAQAPEQIRMIKIPFVSEETARAAFTNPNSPYYNLITMLVNSVPPMFADTYSIVIKKVAANFQMKTVTDIRINPNNFNQISLTLDSYYENVYGANISGQIQVGDLVRFVTKNKSINLQPTNEYLDTYQEFEIVGYSPDGGTVGTGGTEIIYVNKFDTTSVINQSTDYSPTLTTTGQLVEIYTPPSVEDEGVWFRIVTLPIINAHTNNRAHSGSYGPFGSVDASSGGIGQPTFATTVDLSAYVGDPSVHAIVFTNDNGDVQEATTLLIIDFGGGLFKGSIDTDFIYDFTLAAGGRFAIRQDQTVLDGASIQAAVVDLDWGDVVYRQRDMSTGFVSGGPSHSYSFCLDPSWSDYYLSNYYPYGQPCLENSENQRVFRDTGLIHSKKYLTGTTINGLSDFTGLQNRETISQRWGPLTEIIVDGKVVHCVLARVTFPIYIQGTYAAAQNGDQAQPAFSEVTFGGVGREIPYGSVHRGSILVRKGGVITMYDYYNSAVVELTGGGHYDITETNNFKFKKGITTLTSLVEEDFESYTNSVFAIEDVANSEYLLFAYNPSNSDFWGYSFNYGNRAWDYRIPYPIRRGVNLGTFLVSTDGYKIYKHNDGNDAEYYGVKYPCGIWFSMNEISAVLKQAYALGVKSNFAFDVTDILIAPSGAYPSGMSSRIPKGRFVAKEQWWWSDYLRDQSNTSTLLPQQATTQLALHNARELRGPCWLHKIEIDVPQRVVLMSAKVVFELSLQSK